jgi:hypothetical protein
MILTKISVIRIGLKDLSHCLPEIIAIIFKIIMMNC